MNLQQSKGLIIKTLNFNYNRNMFLNLPINSEFLIDDIRQTDKASYLEFFNDKEIYDNTLRIPFPYTPKDADEWIKLCEERIKLHGHPVNWAIRNSLGQLIGGVGFVDFVKGSHKVEIAYWIAKKYWNKGIMTKSVKTFCSWAQKEFAFKRMTASVFVFNKGSARVLEKSGFELEGITRSFYKKDGLIFDGKLYSLISS